MFNKKQIQHIGETVLSLCVALVLGIAAFPAAASESRYAGNEAQSDRVSISGTVTDENGEPLPGASVFVKGTTDGAITDVYGKFTVITPPQCGFGGLLYRIHFTGNCSRYKE